ncbi:carbohydrate kinase family protein [Patescibacteria group bacterium]|nr:carbohydrate kinase family protein [Patescibacteria group bacterium]MBU1931509.1 carbohydrate kinase family protein [Patescibacteria group bacterium]
MIVVAGSIAFDFIMNFPGRFADQIMPDKIHILNLSLLTDKLRKNYGGTAANTAYNLALLGEKPAILATAGKDFSAYKKFLNKAKVNTQYIKIYKNDYTSNYFALVDQSDNQIGGFYIGAMTKASHLSLKKIKPKPRFMILGPTVPQTIIQLAQECQKLNIPYLFDPGVQIPELSASQILTGLRQTEILIGNDYEIAMLKKKTSLNQSALLKQVKILVTTLAEKGSVIKTQNKTITIKAAQPKNTCDPVGAGDAFRAGFVSGYLKNFDLKACGQMGSVSAAYTVEKYGTTTHRFTKKQFCDRYKLNFKTNLII